MSNEIRATVSLFFEIKGADIFGGAESVGYSESKIDLSAVCLSRFDLEEYAREQIKGFAELCKVPEENIRIISRQEYEENTDDD